MSMSKRLLIAFFAALIELIIISAASNQGVTNVLIRHRPSSPVLRELENAVLSVSWRLIPQSGQHTIWYGQLGGNLTLLVLTFVLVWIIVRGPASFSGPFFTVIC